MREGIFNDTDQPAHPHHVISPHCLHEEALSIHRVQSRLWSHCADIQADLTHLKVRVAAWLVLPDLDRQVRYSTFNLSFSMWGRNFSRRHFEMCFLLYSENRLWHFMQIIYILGKMKKSSYEISRLIFSEKNNKLELVFVKHYAPNCLTLTLFDSNTA